MTPSVVSGRKKLCKNACCLGVECNTLLIPNLLCHGERSDTGLFYAFQTTECWCAGGQYIIAL